jgi:hypothetical protein
MSTTAQERAILPRSELALWLALLGPPLVWLVQFEVRYALADNLRPTKPDAVLLSVAAVALLLVVVCAVTSVREWRVADRSPLERMAGTPRRTRFMATLGMMTSALFGLLIIAQALADFFFVAGVQQ